MGCIGYRFVNIVQVRIGLPRCDILYRWPWSTVSQTVDRIALFRCSSGEESVKTSGFWIRFNALGSKLVIHAWLSLGQLSLFYNYFYFVCTCQTSLTGFSVAMSVTHTLLATTSNCSRTSKGQTPNDALRPTDIKNSFGWVEASFLP